MRESFGAHSRLASRKRVRGMCIADETHWRGGCQTRGTVFRMWLWKSKTPSQFEEGWKLEMTSRGGVPNKEGAASRQFAFGLHTKKSLPDKFLWLSDCPNFTVLSATMDEQEFVALLQALLLPDTEKVKAATGQLSKTYYTSPQSVIALIHIINSHSQPQLRQLASVEARKLVTKHWAQIPEAQKLQLREQLLKSTIDEEEKLPRHSKARVIAAIAKVDLEDGQWAELPGILQQAATSQTARHREVGIYIIYTLLETMPDMFQENMTQMLALFNNSIQDPESLEVRINTMLALSELAMVLDTDEDHKSLRSFQNTIPHMVKVLQSTIEAEDEEHSMQAFDVSIEGCTILQDVSSKLSTFADLMVFAIPGLQQTPLLRIRLPQSALRRPPPVLHASRQQDRD